MRVRRFCSYFMLVGMFALGAQDMTALADTVYVNATSLNYRSIPSMSGEILGRLPNGAKVERKRNDGEWSVISVNGKECYVASRYLAAQQATNEQTKAAQNTEGSASASNHAAGEVGLSSEWKYAEFSKINSGKAMYYHSESANRKEKTVCVNAGHGTSGGSSVKTYCHPDGSPKVTGGSTGAGATMATAVSSGMAFNDGTQESAVTLEMAKILKEKLLAAGYDVLMIRETEDVQLDNIARTVIANNRADCHIALHWDSTTKDKGAFYISVPEDASYRAMEPVASHWQSHNRLGSCLVEGLRETGNKIFSSGAIALDLTQTSYSTIPSVDMELGDKASSHSKETLSKLADGLLAGVNRFFN